MSLTLAVLCTVAVNAQNVKGDWYVGTGDIANVSWTEWSVSPTVGYACGRSSTICPGHAALTCFWKRKHKPDQSTTSPIRESQSMR